MYHQPVLANEAVELLINNSNGTYVDGTLGGGGHAERILATLSARGRLIGLDHDSAALKEANARLHAYTNLSTLQANFSKIKDVLLQLQIKKIDGFLLDLGVSSYQIDEAKRGFSFSQNGALDMRMDQRQAITAATIINTWDETEIAGILREYGEEKRARAVAREIGRSRQKQPIESTSQLVEICDRVLSRQHRVKSLARVFQAIRIATNRELENLSIALRDGLDILNKGGRLVVLSYHSLEDRIVKRFFREESKRCTCPPGLPVCVCGQPGQLLTLTKRPIRPGDDETGRNPRSRSARLRAAEKI